MLILDQPWLIQISPANIDPSMYIENRNLHTICISLVATGEVDTIIKGIKYQVLVGFNNSA